MLLRRFFIFFFFFFVFSSYSFAEGFLPIPPIPRFSLPEIPPYPYIYHGPVPVRIPIVQKGELEKALSPELSTLCSVGRFNQSVRGRYFGVAIMDDGSSYYLGYASGKGFNLFDPEKKATGSGYYLFDYDGTGACRVYQFL